MPLYLRALLAIFGAQCIATGFAEGIAALAFVGGYLFAHNVARIILRPYERAKTAR